MTKRDEKSVARQIARRNRILATARAGYDKADKILESVMQKAKPGDAIPLSDGKTAVVIDNFADGKIKSGKFVFIGRYDIKIT